MAKAAARNAFPRFDEVYGALLEVIARTPDRGQCVRPETETRPALYAIGSALPPSDDVPVVNMAYAFFPSRPWPNDTVAILSVEVAASPDGP